MSDRRLPGVTEADAVRVLDGLCAAARIFRLQADEAQPWIEVLAEDYDGRARLPRDPPTDEGKVTLSAKI